MVDAAPNPFEQKIETMIAQLGSRSAAKRRAAAYFLGEAAAADAVSALVEVYERDSDASVRAAAAYSLGMYKAVERTIKQGDEDRVVALLRQIEEEGKLGRRAPRSRVIKTLIALALSLAVLLVLSLFIPDLKALVFGSTRSQSEVVGEMHQTFNLVRNDTRTLQTELLNVIANQPLGCVAYFNNPSSYRIDPIDARSYPDAAALAEQLESVQASLNAAKARYDDACDNNTEFTSAQAQETFQMLLPALQALDPLELELTQAEASAAPAANPTESAPAGPPPQPTAGEGAVDAERAPSMTTGSDAEATTAPLLQATVELQPTIPPEVRAQANPKQYVRALYDIIDDVTAPRGASTLLVQYWEDVQQSGSTAGCDIVNPPAVPSNDSFIPEVNYQVSPNLGRAVQLINSGLASLRDGWVNFRFACNQNNLRDQVAARLQTARVTANAFDAARTLLDQVQNAAD